MKKLIVIFLFLSLLAAKTKPVKVGADVLLESRFDLIKGKRIALVTNQSAILSNGKHLADVLHKRHDVKLVALFGPEHGIRSDASDGITVGDTVDLATGVPVYSLYGKINKPTPEMLNNIDVLLFDVQDVGARYYTYISTMFLCMEAAAENNIHFVVLDRPNPISGENIEGPIRLDSLKSFVWWVPIPIIHGMTIGELAILSNVSGWFKGKPKPKLTIVQLEQWKRSMWFDDTKLPWRKPSPNMISVLTAIVYPGTCLIEGTNVSEGRGTDKPFEYIGAPWIDGKQLAKELNEQNLSGVKFEPIEFTPHDIPSVAFNPKYKEELCRGIFVHVTDRKKLESVKTGLTVIWAINKLYPDSFSFKEKGFDRLMGTPVPREMISSGKNVDDIVSLWENEIDLFRKIRAKALLYLKH
ncbi:MAG: DUF1343 domain-containing protein [Bacteroidota bacterium]|nr:DUF1343 domain-containing protein [Bacteroidota bacterium]